MSIEESKQLIRRFYTEVVDGGDYSNLDSFVATDYVDHNAAEGGRDPDVVAPISSARRRRVKYGSRHLPSYRSNPAKDTSTTTST
jgi:hypothetical protein